MGSLSGTHWLIIVGLLVLMFGTSRLPDAARSLGRSLRILKTEVRDMHENTTKATASVESPAMRTSAAALEPVRDEAAGPAAGNIGE